MTVSMRHRAAYHLSDDPVDVWFGAQEQPGVMAIRSDGAVGLYMSRVDAGFTVRWRSVEPHVFANETVVADPVNSRVSWAPIAAAALTPSLSSVSPTSYPADTVNHTMKLFGSNFQSGDTLTFIPPEGGAIASNSGKLTFVSSTEIDYQFNDGNDTGTWSVRVNSPDGSKHSSYIDFTVSAAALTPSLSSVSPTSYPADTVNHTMKLFGSDFQSGDTLTFVPPEGGTIASNAGKLTFVSSTEIDYQFNDGNDAGTWSVRVNSADGSKHSSYIDFTVSAAALTPSLSSVSPTSYPADTVNHTMKLFGSDFQSGDTLTFIPPEGGTIASNAGKLTLVSSTEIDYQFNDGNDAGTWSVRVNSPDGSKHSSYIDFTVSAAALTPSLSSVSPTSYPADTVNHTMKLFGSDFQSGDTLTFIPPEGGTIASNAGKLTFVSSTEIDYQFNDGNDAGAWSVRVNSPDGSKHSSYVDFTVSAAALTPSLSSVSPTSYPADTVNHTMKLFGSDFQSGDTLTFIPPEGGTIASNAGKLTFVSSTEIDYQFNDDNDAGTWSVRVNSPDGAQHSSYVDFVVSAASALTPSLSSVSPTSYPADTVNHTMKVFGSNFESGDTLTFKPPEGGALESKAVKLTFVSSTEIDYQFNDDSDAGTWSVRVNSADGVRHSSYVSFSVGAAASVDNVHQGVGTSTVLQPGAIISGTINAEPIGGDIALSLADGNGGYVDKDWYKVTLDKGQIYTFSGEAVSLSTNLIDISLYASNGAVAHSAVEGKTPSFIFDTTLQSAAQQTYYFAVSAGGAAPAWKTATGDYTLTFAGHANAASADQIAETIATTAELKSSVTSTIDSADMSGGQDDDYFRVDLQGGHTYSFLSSAGVSASDTLDSVIIRLRDSLGNGLSPTDKTASGPTPSFTYTVPGSGSHTYFIAISASKVGSGNGIDPSLKTGQYSITLEDAGVEATVPPTYPTIENGLAIKGVDTNHIDNLEQATSLSKTMLGKYHFIAQYIGIHTGSISYDPISYVNTYKNVGNLNIVTIYENKNMADSIGGEYSNLWFNYFDLSKDSSGQNSLAFDNGYLDAKRAFNFAATERGKLITAASGSDRATYGLGQPFGTAIYFAIDIDPAGFFKDPQHRFSSELDALNAFNEYFRGVSKYRSEFSDSHNGQSYSIGIYGAGDTLNKILSSGLADYSWIVNNSWAGSKNFVQNNRWDLQQTDISRNNPENTIANIAVDSDIASSPVYGGWNGYTVISGNSIQNEPLVGTGGLLAIQGKSSDVSHVIIGANGKVGVISDAYTGDIRATFSQYSELAYSGGALTDSVNILALQSAGIAQGTVFFNGNGGDDSLDATAGDTDVVATGGEGNDTLLGGGLSDSLSGGNGSDILKGGAGNDVLVGDAGGDQAAAGPQTLTLQPGPEGQDEWITNVYSYNSNYGVDDDRLRVGGWGDYYNALLKFDLGASGLPANVTSATLRLYNLHNNAGAPTPVYIDELHTAWDESYGWHDYDLDYTNLATSGTPDLGWIEIDITQAVNDWLANPAANFGLQLRPVLNNNNFEFFVSSDATGDEAQYRPQLVIHYDGGAGGSGNDTLDGGAGNDIADYSNDTLGIVASLTSGAAIGAGIGKDVLTGIENLTGGSGNDSLSGDQNGNRLDGGAGSDTLAGGAGDDTFVVDNTQDIIRESDGQGTDFVMASASYAITTGYIENLTLTGGANIDGTGNLLNNRLTGNGGDNRLSGGLGLDTLIGGLGNDTYTVDNAGDVVTELNGQGTDTVLSSVSFVLSNALSIETLTLTGPQHINATGNAFANALNGNSGNNTLSGGSGADTMAGGLGHDIYVVENVGDVVIEGVNAGTDTVQSAVTYVLGDNVENLTLAGSGAINGTGNDLANIIYGNAGANVLNGMGGIDKLYGRGGNDTYIIDTAGTGASELLGGTDAGGVDEVRASVSFNLGFYIENLILTGSGNIAGGGNDLANTITGNGGDNILKGRLGNDTLSGGLGADQFVFEASAGKDRVTDFSAAQNDKINVHALAHGVVGGAGIALSQVGGDTVVDLGGGNMVTIVGALLADVQSHMVW